MADVRHYYYIDQDNQQQGPYTIEQLAACRITPTTLVWADGMSEWLPAGQIPDLGSLFTGQQTTPPQFPPKPPVFNNNARNGAPPQFVSSQSLSPYPQKKKNSGAIVVVVLIGLFALVGLGFATFWGYSHYKSSPWEQVNIGDSAITVEDTVATASAVIDSAELIGNSDTGSDNVGVRHSGNVHRLTGYIGKYPVQMVIILSGNGSVSGSYVYTDHPSFGSMRLDGYLDGERIFIEEFPPAQEGDFVTGVFEGVWYGGGMDGTFTRSKDGVMMDFSVAE